MYAKTGTTNDSKDVWFIGCAKAPQNLCISVWMGYDYKECAGTVSATVDGRTVQQKTRVDGPCGGMHDLHGFHDVYGGTLPAQVFSRTFALLAQLQQERAAKAAAANRPTTTAAPSRAPSVSSAPSPASPSLTAAPSANASERAASPSPSASPGSERPSPLLPSPRQSRSARPASPSPSPSPGGTVPLGDP